DRATARKAPIPQRASTAGNFVGAYEGAVQSLISEADLLRVQVESLLRFANDCLSFNLVPNDAQQIENAIRETERAFDGLKSILSQISQASPQHADQLRVYVIILLKSAMCVAALAPAASESTKLALARGRAAHARQVRSKKPRSLEIDNEIEAGCVGWDGKNA